MLRLKEKYIKEIAPAMMEQFKYKSPMEIPKLEKIVINMGLGEVRDNPKALEAACGDLMNEIARACPRVSDVELFDIYRGEQIGEGKKSMAFKIRFEPDDKAFAPEDIERFVKKILGNLKFKLGAEIR